DARGPNTTPTTFDELRGHVEEAAPFQDWHGAPMPARGNAHGDADAELRGDDENMGATSETETTPASRDKLDFHGGAWATCDWNADPRAGDRAERDQVTTYVFGPVERHMGDAANTPAHPCGGLSVTNEQRGLARVAIRHLCSFTSYPVANGLTDRSNPHYAKMERGGIPTYIK
ncbi:unnamed protein product, partial [Prorocentrum cordatum]